jgi:hypothetical protein
MWSLAPNMSRATAAPVSLLDLPAEFRNMIYELLFLQDEPITLSVHESDSEQLLNYVWIEELPFQATINVQLLVTCRQVYLEATPLLYSRNTFVVCLFDDDEGFSDLIKRIGFWLHDLGGS